MSRFQNSDLKPMRWVCPRCRQSLILDAGGYRCQADELHFAYLDGIWRFLLPDREAYFAEFVNQYETVREDEKWGSDSAAYYRALPYKDLSGRHDRVWQIRARSYEALLSRIIEPLFSVGKRPLRIVDLGAGNGWLSYQLAKVGHQVAAIDLLTNPVDGLGAHIHYDVSFETAQAEFDRLPIEDAQVDVVIYNGSLHYSMDYQKTLMEGLRVLKPDGRMVVMDSPIYRDPSSGQAMVSERQARFSDHYNFSQKPLPSEEFLSFDQLNSLSKTLGIQMVYFKPDYGLRWASRYWLARLRRQREPATFLVIEAWRI